MNDSFQNKNTLLPQFGKSIFDISFNTGQSNNKELD